MVGVGKVTLTGGGDGVESVSVPDSNLLMLSSWVTRNAASSSSLGVCYVTAGRSVFDVNGAVVGPLTRAGLRKATEGVYRGDNR